MNRSPWIYLFIVLSATCILPGRARAAVTLCVEGSVGIPGGMVEVRVRADDPAPIAGAAFTLSYDTGHLALDAVVESSFFDVFYPGPEIPGTGARFSGARRWVGPSQDTILVLRLRIKTDEESGSGYVTGDYSLAVTETEVVNPPAGYQDPQILAILTGLDPSEDPLQDPDGAFPDLVTYVRSGTVRIDRDGDGLPDETENALGTDRDQADTDRDGLPDGWETEKGLDPREGTDALADKDWDGFSNLREFLSGTNPGDPLEKPGISIADLDGDGDVDGRDLSGFGSVLGGAPCASCPEDVDLDGDVDDRDLFLAAEEFGRK